MAFPDFHDDTLVAFCDISGFKNKITRNSNRAIESLGKFYGVVYNAVGRTRGTTEPPIYGLVVSDCAILVADNRGQFGNESALKSLLSVIKRINKDSLPHDLMLTTSIAYGRFDYTQRAEFFGLEKNMVTGAAYIEAYKNQSAGSPKLKCGQCRIVPNNLPTEITERLDSTTRTELFRMIIKEKHHYYFYWMLDAPDQISAFNEAYGNTEDLKFLGIRLLLQGQNDLQVRGKIKPHE